MADTPETKVSKQWDYAIEKSLINTGYGLVAGAATAFIFFRSNTWRASVTTFGAGAGLGYSVSEIKNMFEAVKPAAAKSAAPSTPAH